MRPSPRVSDTDLRLLRVLNAVLETNDVTKASDILSVTPSAVSHSLRALRERLGDPLLVQTRGRLQPTPFAESLKPTLRDGLNQLAHLMTKEDTFDPAKSTRSLSLAAPDHQLFLVLPSLIADLRRSAPSVDVKLRTLDHGVAGLLANGDLDLVLAGASLEATLSLNKEVMRSCIISEPFFCLMAPDNPAASLKDFSLEAYLAAPHVAASMVGEESDEVDASLEALGVTRRKAVTVQNFMSAAFYAATSDLIATLPASVARRAAERTGSIIREVPLAVPESAAYLWWHTRFHHDPGHSWWRKRLTEAFAQHRHR